MTPRSLVLPSVLSVAVAAALLWLLAPRQTPVGAAMPPAPTATPTPAPRYVAVTGSDADNDCTAASAPCRTIQRAVDLAWGDTAIRVAQGTYRDVHERDGVTQVVHLDKRVSLQGGYTTTNGFAAPPQPELHPTVLDAQGQGRVITIEGAGPTIEGLTITGGAGYYSGAGVWAHSPFGLILRHNRIVGNAADGNGGAVFISGGFAELRDNLIADNTANWSAGLALLNDTDVAVVKNEIRGNQARLKGGGIDVNCCGRTTALISRNHVVENNGGGGGGGVRVISTHARVVNNVLALNEARTGGGILLEDSTGYPVSATLAHNTLVGRGDGDEGVRAGPYATVTLVNNIVVSYTTGITNADPVSTTVTADHTLFAGNGTDYGPGVSSTNAIVGPPAFVSAESGDYHITGASAAESAGVDVGVRVDVDNDLRLGIPDVGADEYWAPGWPKRAYLPLIRISPFPDHPPRIEPKTGDRFACDGYEGGHCSDGISNRRLVDVDVAYRTYGAGSYCPPRWLALQEGDPVIVVGGTIENVSDEGYWTMVSGAAYDGSDHLLGRNVDMTFMPAPGPVPVFLPAQGTGDFLLHLKSNRAIELIRIDAAGASSVPPP